MNLKVLVLGCGSIGKRHIKNLIDLNISEILAYDSDEKKRENVKNIYGIEVIDDLSYSLKHNEINSAIICSPPSFHIQNALHLTEFGIHCLIEKPLSNNLNDIDTLINLVKKKKTTVLVGFNMRFSKLLKKLKALVDDGNIGKILSINASCGYYLPYWRPNDDYSQSYSARSELGGGVVLDCAHEIDFITYLAGDVNGIFATIKKTSDLKINTEDYAAIIMHHDNGIVSQIHLDYLQSNYKRSCEIIGDKGMIIWDINKRTLKHYSLIDKEFHVYYDGINANVNDMYLEEVQCFFQSIKRKDQSLTSLEEGRHVQKIIHAIKESSRKNEFQVI